MDFSWALNPKNRNKYTYLCQWYPVHGLRASALVALLLRAACILGLHTLPYLTGKRVPTGRNKNR